LTENDIRERVRRGISGFASASMIEELVRKAHGVFLWADLAVKSLEAAHVNGDTPKQISDRLEELPDELEAMYEHMFRKIDRVYRDDVALYFTIAIDYGTRFFELENYPPYLRESPSIMQMFFATQPKYWDQVLSAWSLDTLRQISEGCRQLEFWIRSTYGILEVRRTRTIHGSYERYCQHGKLIEVGPETIESELILAEIDTYISEKEVLYVHRSFLEYLVKRPNDEVVQKMRQVPGIQLWLRYDVLLMAIARAAINVSGTRAEELVPYWKTGSAYHLLLNLYLSDEVCGGQELATAKVLR
jgi:hypothetical protein